jgi:NAD(P)-dependent dehydrogenase (short-subunit alcohol dehydrogenase family)
MMDLSDKAIIVTGAGSGIGYAVAENGGGASRK